MNSIDTAKVPCYPASGQIQQFISLMFGIFTVLNCALNICEMFVISQGDGTAVCLANNPAVFTLSMHAANNFPARKQKSTLDVPLPDGMEDDDYLR